MADLTCATDKRADSTELTQDAQVIPNILSVAVVKSASMVLEPDMTSLVDMTDASNPTSSIASTSLSAVRRVASCSARPCSAIKLTESEINPGSVDGETILSMLATQEAHVIPFIDRTVLAIS